MLRVVRFASSCLSLATLACGAPEPAPTGVELTRAWTSEPFAGCVLASPLEHEGRVIVASGDGRIAALGPEDGAIAWSVSLPHPDGEIAHVIATPAIAEDRLIVTWQNVAAGARDPAAAPRSAHRVAVIDLSRGELDARFPILDLQATLPSADDTGDVPFLAGNALSRARLVHAATPGRALGLVYVSFGNARDIQPWHGWVFEIDLDAWRSGAGSLASVLLTTPTSECGAPGTSGATDRICGGGVWSPAGPLLVPSASGAALIVPTGNGDLDLVNRRYAHTLMRVQVPGLAFDPGCDASACAGFDALAPDRECLASCADLFVPRLMPADPPFDAPGCQGLSFFECYAVNDWDLGANTPASVALDGQQLLLLPAKDGGLYLVDGEHLGTLHDRLTVREACGAGGASCSATWAGSMVTQPAMTELDGAPFAIVPTFMFDDRNEAGLVAVRVVSGVEGPRLERAWSYPEAGTSEARSRFRRHPSAAALVTAGGVEHAAVVEVGRLGVSPGILHVVRVRDGALADRAELDGPGQRFAQPLAIGARLFLASCDDGNAGPSHLEAWDLRAP